jgi:putative spermidine/putrescine transport system substrate-binding protein
MLFRPLLAALLVLCGAACPAGARELNVVLRDGGWVSGLRQLFIEPFAAITGMPVRADQVWDGQIETLGQALKASDGKTGATDWDLVLLPSQTLASACKEGLLEKLDWSTVGGKDHYRERAVSECGVGAFVDATILAWDREKFPGTPGWGDFWDVAKVPGKRGLFRSPRGALEFALLADGVTPGDVYDQLRTTEGVDRAFRRLDQLRPFIVWWESGEEAARLLSSGQVLMTSAPFARIAAANRTGGRNFGVQWAGGLARTLHWAIVKASPNAREARQFLYFAGLPALQARLLGYGGLAKDVPTLLSPAAKAELVTDPANLSALLAVDEGFWQEQAEKLDPRFAAWLGR